MTLECEGIFFEETRHPEPFWMPRHTHDEAHLVLLFDGSIECFSGKQSSRVARSDVLFIPAGETHATQYHSQVHAFYLRFRAAWWEKISRNAPALSTPREYNNSPPTRLATRLYREFHRRDNLTPFLLEGLTLELLVAMARQQEPLADPVLPRWLTGVREYLHAHCTEPLSLETVAAAVGVHPGHLTRAFRQHFHCTMGDYVRTLRIERACQRLAAADAELSLAQMARDLGFSDQSHFCKTFRQITGMTPTEARDRAGHARQVQK